MTDDGSPRAQRERLERELMAKMRHAKEEYRAASAEYELVRQSYADMLDHPDGALALHKAAMKERAALQAYTFALKTFNDFVVFGRLPKT